MVDRNRAEEMLQPVSTYGVFKLLAIGARFSQRSMRLLRLCEALDGLTNRDFATAEATELLPLLSLPP